MSSFLSTIVDAYRDDDGILFVKTKVHPEKPKYAWFRLLSGTGPDDPECEFEFARWETTH